MVTKERMKQLEDFVKFWRDSLDRAEKQLASLLEAKRIGISITDDVGKDILRDRISQEDIAVRAYKRGLIHAESNLGRAQNGEEV